MNIMLHSINNTLKINDFECTLEEFITNFPQYTIPNDVLCIIHNEKVQCQKDAECNQIGQSQEVKDFIVICINNYEEIRNAILNYRIEQQKILDSIIADPDE